MMVADATLLDVAADYLTQAGKEFERTRRHDGVDVVQAEFAGQYVRMDGFFAPIPGQSILAVYVVAIERVPRARRPAVAELLVRLNSGLGVGRLDLSFETGELQAYASIPAWDATLSPHQLHALLVSNLGNLDLLMQVIRCVIDESMTPEQAVQAMPPTHIHF